MTKLIIVSCKYFALLIEYIKKYFEKQGITCIVVDIIDECFKTETYLIFDIRDRVRLPIHFIVYNFEQLEASNLSDEFYLKLILAKHIFDYSQNNIKFLNTMNIAASFMPYSWFPNLRNISNFPIKNRICSFMFIGYFNERRKNILKPIHQNAKDMKQKMLISGNLWGINYANQASETKISLNIHCYEKHTILEVHRIITCILDKNIVLTERSSDAYYDDLLDGCVTWITAENVVEIINDTLYNKELDLDNLVTERINCMMSKMKIFCKILDEHKTTIINELT